MAYNEDYYKKLEEEDYKTLLQSQIQLDNARQRALKNTQSSLAAQGMANSGYGQTAKTGIESQYIQGLQNAQQNYQNNVDQHRFEQAQAQAQAQEADAHSMLYDTVTGAMQNQTTQQGLDEKLVTFGYRDAEGNWTDKFNNLSENDRMYLESLYGDMGRQITANSEANALNKVYSAVESGYIQTKEDFDKVVAEVAPDTSNWSEENKTNLNLIKDEISKNDISTSETRTNQINNITTTYSDITANGSKFKVTVNNTDYTPAVGKEADDQSKASNHQIGDIWVQVEDNGSKPNLYLVMKGNDGKTHYVDTDSDNLSKDVQLQFYADMLSELGYTVEYKSGEKTIKVNGVTYKYDRTGVDSIEEK